MALWPGGRSGRAVSFHMCVAALIASSSSHLCSSHQTKVDKSLQGQVWHGAVLPAHSDGGSWHQGAANRSVALEQAAAASGRDGTSSPGRQDIGEVWVENGAQDSHGQAREIGEVEGHDPNRRWHGLHLRDAGRDERRPGTIASPVALVQVADRSGKDLADGGSETKVGAPEDAKPRNSEEATEKQPDEGQHSSGDRDQEAAKEHESTASTPPPSTTNSNENGEKHNGLKPSADLLNLAHKIENHISHDGEQQTSAAEFTGVKKNSAQDLDAIVKAMCFSTFCSFGCVAAFVLLLRFLPAVYAHRIEPSCEDDYDNNLPVPSPCSLISWGQVALSVRDEYVIKTVGLDGFMLTELHVLCQRILQVIAPTAILVLCPLHLFLGAKDMPNKGARIPMDILSRCGIDAVTNTWLVSSDQESSNTETFKGHVLCWAHVAMVWFVVFFTVRMMFRAQYRFLRYRFQWLKDMPAPRSTTLMVENIPQEQRSDEALHAYFSRMFSDHAVERAYVVKRTKKLQGLLRKEKDLRRQLQLAEAQLEARWRDGERTSVLDDVGSFLARAPTNQETIHVLAEKVEKAQHAVESERLQIEAKGRLQDNSVCSTSGFVTFTTRRWKRLASREQLKADASLLTMQTPPDPSDVRYEDLARDPSLQATNNMVANLLVFMLFLSWLPLTIGLTSLTSLDSLMGYKAFFWLEPLKQDRFAFLKTTVEGICSTLALKVVLALLPSILVAIIYNFRTLKSGNMVQLSLQSRYFMFLLIFVVLVSGINMTLIHSLADIVENPNNIFVLFSRLPSSSNFYISYVVLGWFTVTMGLLRVAPAIKYLMFSWSGLSPSNARRHSEPEDQDSDGMGTRMAKATIMMTIALVFCTCSPTIPTATLVYFVLGARVSRWNVMYAETKKPDLGGAFWVLSLKHIFVSLGIYVLLMCAIMLKARYGHGLPAAGIFLCGVALFWSYWSFEQIVWETLPFEEIAEADIEDRKRTLTLGAPGHEHVGEYFQSELGEMSTDRPDELIPPGLGDQSDQSASASSTQRWSQVLTKPPMGIA